MAHFNRKSAPKVKSGRVQRQNNWMLTRCFCNSERRLPVIDRKRPGADYRHLLRKMDVAKFIAILPDWDEVSKGLNAIVLAQGDEECFGFHIPGSIHICAWSRDMAIMVSKDFYEKSADLLDRLGVQSESKGADRFICKFTEQTARAHQLLSTFLHELGHHYDRMTTKSKIRSSRGEPYANEYARKYEARIWGRYQEVFEL